MSSPAGEPATWAAAADLGCRRQKLMLAKPADNRRSKAEYGLRIAGRDELVSEYE